MSKFETAAKMMPGSSTGPTYFPIALKGSVLLGAKVIALGSIQSRGKKFTSVIIKLRSAPNKELIRQPGNVAELAPNEGSLVSAWPNLKFARSDHSRASVEIQTLYPGSISPEEAAPEKVLDLIDEKLGKDFADYITAAVGEDALITTKDEIVETITSCIKKLTDKGRKALESADEIIKELAAPGSFKLMVKATKEALEETEGAGFVPASGDGHDAPDDGHDAHDNDEDPDEAS